MTFHTKKLFFTELNSIHLYYQQGEFLQGKKNIPLNRFCTQEWKNEDNKLSQLQYNYFISHDVAAFEPAG